LVELRCITKHIIHVDDFGSNPFGDVLVKNGIKRKHETHVSNLRRIPGGNSAIQRTIKKVIHVGHHPSVPSGDI
jgi:hypothetical protein